MLVSQANVTVEQPARYLGQLCKHFQHRLEVSCEGPHGRITFPVGVCSLEAGEGVLTMRAEAADREQLAQLQEVVSRHLLRFAFRSPPEIVWSEVQA